MMFGPEFLMVALVFLCLTGAVWLSRYGLSSGISAFPAKPMATGLSVRSIQRQSASRVMLPSSSPAFDTGSSQLRTAENRRSLSVKFSNDINVESQLCCLSRIVNSAIEAAASAERLHCAARDQLDGAHYAIQNLFDELSAVMTITASPMSRRDTNVVLRHSSTPLYVTALAA